MAICYWSHWWSHTITGLAAIKLFVYLQDCVYNGNPFFTNVIVPLYCGYGARGHVEISKILVARAWGLGDSDDNNSCCITLPLDHLLQSQIQQTQEPNLGQTNLKNKIITFNKKCSGYLSISRVYTYISLSSSPLKRITGRWGK